MNLGTFSGNLTKACEVRKLGSGTSICSFTIAVNSGYGDKQHTDYVDCAIFGKRADGRLPEFLKKGTQVVTSGTLQLAVREYEGKTYANMKLFVHELDLVGGQNQEGGSAPAANKPAPAAGGADPYDDDIPF